MVGKRVRRSWAEAEKLMIVAQTRMPGVSVSQVARRYDVNANMVFKWRRQYRAGYFGVSGMGPRIPPVNLIPVLTPTVSERQASARQSDSVIEVMIDDVTLRLHGGVDPTALGTVLDCLARRR